MAVGSTKIKWMSLQLQSQQQQQQQEQEQEQDQQQHQVIIQHHIILPLRISFQLIQSDCVNVYIGFKTGYPTKQSSPKMYFGL